MLARKRTDMASERTDLSLIRSGFTVASFGAGLTQIIGRGRWSNLAVDLLTILFMLVGAIWIQIGLYRLHKVLKETEDLTGRERTIQRLLIFGVTVLQLAIAVIVVLIAIHM